MSILGPSVTTAELHLDYLSGDKHATSPIDPEVRGKVSIAKGDVVSTAVSSVFSGVYSGVSNLLTGLAVWPLIPLDTRASFMGSNSEKVCAVVTENAQAIQELTAGLGGVPLDFLKSSSEFLNSVGIPLDLSRVNLTDDPNSYTVLPEEMGFRLLKLFDNGVQKVADWFGTLSTNEMCLSKVAEGSWTYADRAVNYLGSVVTTAQKLYNFEYSQNTPYIAVGVVAALSLWSFAETFNAPALAAQDAKNLLTARFDAMESELKTMKSEMKKNPFQKDQTITLARGIIDNYESVLKEIKALDLPQFNSEEMMNKVTHAARSIFVDAA